MSLTSSWRSPSNIALIKYWGKHGLQLPRNPSLSLTLSACHTDMHVRVETGVAEPAVSVFYDGHPAPAFEPKINAFLKRLEESLPWLKHSSIKIDSINTFPHSAGIASSASAMSALALCLADLDEKINNNSLSPDAWLTRVSEFARLGSGSACRSVFPKAAIWGRVQQIDHSSDVHAISWSDQIAPVFQSFQDAILVVSRDEKTVSSSAGHELMNTLPYAETRYVKAEANLLRLVEIMTDENRLVEFISIVESEAMQLHALMMMGDTPYMLFEPGTISIIREIWKFRKDTGLPVCFTLDAGPNVHMLYPENIKAEVHDFIQTQLLQYCKDGIFILDEVGQGPIDL